jgi:plasmid replication initiation protein
VDWLKEQFQLSDKYPRMYDFKKRVLQPAVDEINEHSNLWVRWSQRKSGRTVIALQFQFGIKASAETQAAKEVTGSKEGTRRRMTRKEIERQARPGETWAQAETRLRGSR